MKEVKEQIMQMEKNIPSSQCKISEVGPFEEKQGGFCRWDRVTKKVYTHMNN